MRKVPLTIISAELLRLLLLLLMIYQDILFSQTAFLLISLHVMLSMNFVDKLAIRCLSWPKLHLPVKRTTETLHRQHVCYELQKYSYPSTACYTSTRQQNFQTSPYGWFADCT